MARLLVVRFSALGDLASTVPFIRSLDPEHQITLFTSPLGAEYFADEGCIDEIKVLENKKISTLLKHLPGMFSAYDYYIDLHGNDRSKFCSLFTRAKVLSNYTKGFTQRMPEGELMAYAKPGSACQFDYFSIPSMLPGYEFRPEPFEQKPKDYIVINAGSSEKWKSKRLSFEKWEEIIRVLLDRYELPFIFTGSADEAEYVRDLAARLPGKSDVVAGKTSLKELKEVLGRAYLTVSTDSGPMHISAVEKTPTIGLFGATNWIRSAPYGPWSTVAFDRKRYPDAQPPAKMIQTPGDYYRNIDIEAALSEIKAFI